VLATVLAILGAVIPFLFDLIRRKITSKNDPQTQHSTRLDSIDKAIAGKDSGVDAVNVLLVDFQRVLDSKNSSLKK
jgi:hypothetical protein